MIVDAWGARNAMALGGLSNAVNLTMYWMIATERWPLKDDLELLILVLSVLGVLIFMGCALGKSVACIVTHGVWLFMLLLSRVLNETHSCMLYHWLFISLMM